MQKIGWKAAGAKG